MCLKSEKIPFASGSRMKFGADITRGQYFEVKLTPTAWENI